MRCWNQGLYMKALVILNPLAGESSMHAVLDALTRRFAGVGVQFEIYETRKDDRLGDIVRGRVGDGFDRVVAVGGDGTVSGVSDGLLKSAIPLGILPTGTGNLIARELNIPVDMDAALALIAGARCRKQVDAMRIGKRAYFLNISVGISASVVGQTTSTSKGRFGRVAYVGATILKVLSSRPRYLVISVDGQAHPYRAVEVTIMNCGLLAKTFYPKGPDIRMDDGQLGVWILSMQTIWDYFRYAIGVMAGSHVNRAAQFIRAEKTVSIRSNRPFPVQADGDIIGTTPVEVEVLPGALTVLVPETSPVAPEEDAHYPVVG